MGVAWWNYLPFASQAQNSTFLFLSFRLVSFYKFAQSLSNKYTTACAKRKWPPLTSTRPSLVASKDSWKEAPQNRSSTSESSVESSFRLWTIRTMFSMILMIIMMIIIIIITIIERAAALRATTWKNNINTNPVHAFEYFYDNAKRNVLVNGSTGNSWC